MTPNPRPPANCGDHGEDEHRLTHADLIHIRCSAASVDPIAQPPVTAGSRHHRSVVPDVDVATHTVQEIAFADHADHAVLRIDDRDRADASFGHQPSHDMVRMAVITSVVIMSDASIAAPLF